MIITPMYSRVPRVTPRLRACFNRRLADLESVPTCKSFEIIMKISLNNCVSQIKINNKMEFKIYVEVGEDVLQDNLSRRSVKLLECNHGLGDHL